jgi:hypothetical protein
MAYITKRGSSYSVRYTYQDEHGKSCDKWESFPTKEEAVKRQKQIEHELATGNFLIPSTVTVGEFLMDWLPKQCSKHKWAPKTYQSNLALIQNLIIPYIGKMRRMQPLSTCASVSFCTRCMERLTVKVPMPLAASKSMSSGVRPATSPSRSAPTSVRCTARWRMGSSMLSSAARISSTSQMLRSWVVFLGVLRHL